jgi:hypothetical protein
LKDERQPDAGRLEGKGMCRAAWRDKREIIGGFPGLIGGAGAGVVGLLFAIVLPAATAAGFLFLLGLQ